MTLRQQGFGLKREFNVTDDRRNFSTTQDDKTIVFEGKMIHQYNSSFSEPKYFIDDSFAYNILLEREIRRLKEDLETDKNLVELKKEFISRGFSIEKEFYRFGYRDVGGATNERTLISSIIPPNVYSVNTIIHVVNNKYIFKDDALYQETLEDIEKVFLMSLFNSLTLNYYMRNRISSHASMFIVNELPIAKTTKKMKDRIVKLGFILLYKKSNITEFDELRDKLNILVPEVVDEISIRAELEVLIAKGLYGLDKTDWDYLTSTFIYGDESQSKKELDLIIEESKLIYD